NDTYGHRAGDAVLAEAARRMNRTKRASDVLIRYGGGEFLALLPGTDGEGAIVVAEKMREAVASELVVYREAGGSEIEIWVRVSVGVACLDPEMYDGALLVA